MRKQDIVAFDQDQTITAVNAAIEKVTGQNPGINCTDTALTTIAPLCDFFGIHYSNRHNGFWCEIRKYFPDSYEKYLYNDPDVFIAACKCLLLVANGYYNSIVKREPKPEN